MCIRDRYKGGEYTVVGVVAGMKQNPLSVSRPTLIIPNHTQQDSRFEYTVRVKEGKADNFRNLMSKEFTLMMGKDNVRLSFGNIDVYKRQGQYYFFVHDGLILNFCLVVFSNQRF